MHETKPSSQARARPRKTFTSRSSHALPIFSVDFSSAVFLTSRLIGGVRNAMKVLCCHPSGLMYTEIFLRLEPLGVELVAAACRHAGHDVRLMDLQADSHKDYFKLL